MLEDPVPPDALESTMFVLASSSTILERVPRLRGRAAAASNLVRARVGSKDPDQDCHGDTAGNAHTQDANHGVVAATVLVRSLCRILRPTRVQGIGGGDTAEIAQARDER